MDKALVVFSRKGLMREAIAARDVRSREHARKLWPMVDPDARGLLVTWVSPSFEDGRLKKRSHFRRLPDAGPIDLRQRFDSDEAERQRLVSESEEHKRAKVLLVAELERRMHAGLGLPWAFKDDSASDFPLIGNLLLGATQVVSEHPLDTPFGSSYRLDIAVIGAPISQRPMLLGGIEIERWHHFDGRKAMIGRSMGFPLITIDISELDLADLTEDWASTIFTNTTRSDAQGRRTSYVYLHDLLYPQFVTIPKEIAEVQKHQYLVFANDAAIDQLGDWLRRLGEVLGYSNGQVQLQRLNAKSPSAQAALESAGSVVGDGWMAFNNQRMLRVSVPRPTGPHDERAHKLHATLARLLLSRDCLVGYQYATAIYNNEPDEDVWLRYRWRPEHRTYEVYRVLPKRLSEPIGRLMAFLQSIGAEDASIP